jgi:hypothetical protein
MLPPNKTPVTPLTNAVTDAVSPVPPARSKLIRSAVNAGMRRDTCIPEYVITRVEKKVVIATIKIPAHTLKTREGPVISIAWNRI